MFCGGWAAQWPSAGGVPPRFLDGLQAAQGGPEASHTTVIGHSYGSTTVGAASKAPGHLAADDIVVSGCWRAPEGTDLTTQY